MQCKDIPDRPVLEFLAAKAWQTIHDHRPATWFACAMQSDGEWGANSVMLVMPSGIPEKLALAKMRQLIRRGVVDGCPCGCRGDFKITEKGNEELVRSTP